MKKIDFYFSESLHNNQMNPMNWYDNRDAYMPVVKINGEFVPFSEQIEHGKTPHLKHADLKLIGTLYENEVKFKRQSKKLYAMKQYQEEK